MGNNREADDLRIKKTRATIQTAFIQMLAETPFSEITVATLMKKAGYSRGAFYLHYQNVWEVYEEVMRAYVEDLFSGYREEIQAGKSENEQAFQVVYEVIHSVKKWYPFGKALLNKLRVPNLMPEIVEAYALQKSNEKAMLFPASIVKYADSQNQIAQEMGMRFAVVNLVAMFEAAAKYVTPNMSEQEMLVLAENMHAGNVAFNQYEKNMDIYVIKH